MVTITCSVGGAAAQGNTAHQKITLKTATGAADAAGILALLRQGVQATVGNANALGSTAFISSSIQTSEVAANASGVAVLLNQTIVCSIGVATAGGVEAVQTTRILTAAGTAIARGVAALFSSSNPRVTFTPNWRSVTDLDNDLHVLSAMRLDEVVADSGGALTITKRSDDMTITRRQIVA